MSDEMPFNLLIAGLLLEEFSYFIPTMYFWVCHYRVFSQTERNANRHSGSTLEKGSKYELLLSGVDPTESESNEEVNRDPLLYASISQSSKGTDSVAITSGEKVSSRDE